MSEGPTVTMRHLDEGRIVVVDGLFSQIEILMLERMAVDLPYFRSNYDRGKEEGRKHLRHNFSKSFVEKFPPVRHFRDCVLSCVRDYYPHRAGKIEQFFALDQYYGAYQLSHFDTPGGVTALYFANADWQADWQGETIFYDNLGEACVAVAPKPGRLCIFPGEIVHRGGVPSPLCKIQRLTLVIKSIPLEVAEPVA